MMQILLLLAIGGLLRAAQSFVPSGELQQPAFSAALAFGFVMLSALFAGRLIEKLKMPKLTGYLVTGLVAGPFALQLITAPMVSALRLVEGTAVCLIALTAGGELNFEKVKPLLRIVRSMTLWAVVGGALLLTLAVLAVSPLLSFMQPLTIVQAVAVSTVIGITLASQSPAVVIALLEETRSDGPVSQTTLALVVISDLVVIVLFAVASSVANVVMGGTAEPVATLLAIAWELFGSMVIGLVVGILMAIYLRQVKGGRALFVLVVCIVVAELGRAVHLDPLIVMLAAGVFIENVTQIEASELIHDIESASLPLYLVFFAVAGAVIRIDLLASVAVPALILVAVRALGFWWGSRRAGRVTGAPEAVTKYTWIGLLPQAGLALALALLIKRTFPTFGAEASVLVLSIAGINQLVTPVFLRLALVRAGEAGRREVHDFGHGEETEPPPETAVAARELPKNVRTAHPAPPVPPDETS